MKKVKLRGSLYGIPPWYIRFLLKFCRLKYEEATDGLRPYAVQYKTLFGLRYVLLIYPTPLEHPNCRCALERRNE